LGSVEPLPMIHAALIARSISFSGRGRTMIMPFV